MFSITRLLEMDAGHRLMGHESKCKNVHGHRYRFEVTCEARALDEVGRVIDFGVVKQRVGGWIDDTWDHGFIYQAGDAIGEAIAAAGHKVYKMACAPSAENIAAELHLMAGMLLAEYELRVVNVRCWETPNCYADSHGFELALGDAVAAIDAEQDAAERRAMDAVEALERGRAERRAMRKTDPPPPPDDDGAALQAAQGRARVALGLSRFSPGPVELEALAASLGRLGSEVAAEDARRRAEVAQDEGSGDPGDEEAGR
jgi:6-pyruvoyltetrahydropterin/6-carboxytetrahydropterin synthase